MDTTRNLELGEYLRHKKVDTVLAALIESVAGSAATIADHVKGAGSVDQSGIFEPANEPTDLNLLADRVVSKAFVEIKSLAAFLSKETEEVVWLKDPSAGDFILYFDPLVGSPDLTVDLAVGSIFAVSQVMTDGDRDIRRMGREYLCAGYVIYGPSAMLVLTFGVGVIGFTLDPDDARFKLTQSHIRIPAETNEIAVDTSRRNNWCDAIRRYVDECEAGFSGPRGYGFNLRGKASMVADVHRILARGGVLLLLADEPNHHVGDKLRLRYEANAIALLVEAAGGRASTGFEDILRIHPQFFNQPASVLLGSIDEIDRLVQLHKIYQAEEEIAS